MSDKYQARKAESPWPSQSVRSCSPLGLATNAPIGVALGTAGAFG